MFVRVRSKVPGDPLHEFHVAERLAALKPDLYEVIDPKLVADARPASFVPGHVPVPASAEKTPAPAKKRARKDLVKTTAPSGADS